MDKLNLFIILSMFLAPVLVLGGGFGLDLSSQNGVGLTQDPNGLLWSSIIGIPAGFADGVDDVGGAGGSNYSDAGINATIHNVNITLWNRIDALSFNEYDDSGINATIAAVNQTNWDRANTNLTNVALTNRTNNFIAFQNMTNGLSIRNGLNLLSASYPAIKLVPDSSGMEYLYTIRADQIGTFEILRGLTVGAQPTIPILTYSVGNNWIILGSSQNESITSGTNKSADLGRQDIWWRNLWVQNITVENLQIPQQIGFRNGNTPSFIFTSTGQLNMTKPHATDWSNVTINGNQVVGPVNSMNYGNIAMTNNSNNFTTSRGDNNFAWQNITLIYSPAALGTQAYALYITYLQTTSAVTTNTGPLYIKSNGSAGYIAAEVAGIATTSSTSPYAYKGDMQNKGTATTYGAWFQSSAYGISYGFQGYGETKDNDTADEAIGVYGYSVAPGTDNAQSLSIGLRANPAFPSTGLNATRRKFGIDSMQGHNLFDDGITYFTKGKTVQTLFQTDLTTYLNNTLASDQGSIYVENKAVLNRTYQLAPLSFIQNTTAITCGAGYDGSFIYSGGKLLFCNTTRWYKVQLI